MIYFKILINTGKKHKLSKAASQIRRYVKPRQLLDGEPKH